MHPPLPDNEYLRRWLEHGQPEEGTHAEWGRLVEASGRLEVPAGQDPKQVWANLEPRLLSDQVEQAAKKSYPASRRWWYAVAAAVAFICVAGITYYYTLSSTTGLSTAYAEQQTLQLPDGSHVHLNADSRLSYTTAGWQEARVLELEGEAYFEVVKGGGFIVRCPQGRSEGAGYSLQCLCPRCL